MRICTSSDQVTELSYSHHGDNWKGTLVYIFVYYCIYAIPLISAGCLCRQCNEKLQGRDAETQRQWGNIRSGN